MRKSIDNVAHLLNKDLEKQHNLNKPEDENKGGLLKRTKSMILTSASVAMSVGTGIKNLFYASKGEESLESIKKDKEVVNNSITKSPVKALNLEKLIDFNIKELDTNIMVETLEDIHNKDQINEFEKEEKLVSPKPSPKVSPGKKLRDEQEELFKLEEIKEEKEPDYMYIFKSLYHDICI